MKKYLYEIVLNTAVIECEDASGRRSRGTLLSEANINLRAEAKREIHKFAANKKMKDHLGEIYEPENGATLIVVCSAALKDLMVNQLYIVKEVPCDGYDLEKACDRRFVAGAEKLEGDVTIPEFKRS